MHPQQTPEQEAQAPAPQLPAQPPQPMVVQPTDVAGQQRGPVSQSDFLKIANGKKRRKKFIIGLIFSAALIAAGTFVYVSGILTPLSLKETTYSNGVGSTYKLDFYTKYHTDKLAVNPKKTTLVGDKGRDGKAPLLISISDSALTDATRKGSRNETCASRTPIATVYNEYAGKNINICDFFRDTKNKGTSYLAAFRAHDKLFVVLITQDQNFDEAKTPDQARKILSETGLAAYDNDIAKIVASIRLSE